MPFGYSEHTGFYLSAFVSFYFNRPAMTIAVDSGRKATNKQKSFKFNYNVHHVT